MQRGRTGIWNKLLCGLLCLVLSAALAGCAADTGGEKQEQHYTFGFTGMDLTDLSFRAALTELQAAVEEKGDTLLTCDPQLDNEKQLQGIRDMLDQGMDLLVLGPVDADGVRPALEACREAGVPVVCFDSKATDAELLATFVGGDNYRLGLLIGQEILRDFPQGGSLGLLTNPLAHSVTERERGLRDALAGSEVEVAACLEVTGYDEVLPKAERILSEHPEINILWGLNDDITLLLHSSVLAIGQEDRVSIYGTGGLFRERSSDNLVEAVRKGYVRAVSLQEPAQWGVLCAELGYRLLAGEELEDEYLCDSVVVNGENVGEYEAEW